MIIAPHSGVGTCAPSPTKLSAASAEHGVAEGGGHLDEQHRQRCAGHVARDHARAAVMPIA